MRNIASTAAVLTAALTLVAAARCAHAPTGTSASGTTASNAATSKKVSPADEAFFRAAYSDARAELSIGHMAQQKGTTSHVKQLGQKLVSDSTRQLTHLKNLASKNGITLPTALETRNEASVSHLSHVTGQIFDRDFLTHVRQREQAVLSDLQREDKVGTNPGVRSYAANELATVRSQIDAARRVGVTAPQKGVAEPQKAPPKSGTTAPQPTPKGGR